jgi:hypothetical protein
MSSAERFRLPGLRKTVVVASAKQAATHVAVRKIAATVPAVGNIDG